MVTVLGVVAIVPLETVCRRWSALVEGVKRGEAVALTISVMSFGAKPPSYVLLFMVKLFCNQLRIRTTEYSSKLCEYLVSILTKLMKRYCGTQHALIYSCDTIMHVG